MNRQRFFTSDHHSDLDLAGAFVETAYTFEHIERTIEEEKRLGIRKGPCAFLDDQNSNVMTDQVGKETARMVRSEITIHSCSVVVDYSVGDGITVIVGTHYL